MSRAVPTVPAGAAGRIRRLLRDDAGMSTVEYAVGTVAAAAFAAVLYAVLPGDDCTLPLCATPGLRGV